MGKIKSKGVEKRKFQRLEVPLNITLKVVTEQKILGELQLLKFTSRNVSQQGICIETSQIVVDNVNLLSGSPGARENRLEMKIELGPEDEEILHVSGEVCWYDVVRDEEEFMYQVGIVFTDFEGQGKEKLKNFLKKQQKNKNFLSKIFSY